MLFDSVDTVSFSYPARREVCSPEVSLAWGWIACSWVDPLLLGKGGCVKTRLEKCVLGMT